MTGAKQEMNWKREFEASGNFMNEYCRGEKIEKILCDAGNEVMQIFASYSSGIKRLHVNKKIT